MVRLIFSGLLVSFLLMGWMGYTTEKKPAANGLSVESQINVNEHLDTVYKNEIKTFISFIGEIIYSNEARHSYNLIDTVYIPYSESCLKFLNRGFQFFSKEELDTIQQQLKRPDLKTWTPELAKNAVIIKQETIQSILKDSAKGWEKLYQQYPASYGYKSFSAPIFLRNYSLCLFYSYSHSNNIFGTGKKQFHLYIKLNNKWEIAEYYCD